MDSISLLRRLVSLPGPPGQEAAVRDFLIGEVELLGLPAVVDAKGNLRVSLGEDGRPPLMLVTAHMDELALMVQRVHDDGALAVAPLGGVHPWKWGEGPVEVLAPGGSIPGVLSFGSVHTEDPASVVVQAREEPVRWRQTRVITGRGLDDLRGVGVHPGVRVVMASSRRELLEMDPFVASYFLDDRADLVAWLLALERLAPLRPLPVMFAATVAEEVGGEGAKWLLGEVRPPICVALELGPIVPDCDVRLTAAPTVWAVDGYAAIDARDIEILDGLGVDIQWQALSRGGSDASCSAAAGLTARPVTFGIPMENTHGFEIIHNSSMEALAELTVRYVQRVASDLKQEGK